jgi:hypothetical protein
MPHRWFYAHNGQTLGPVSPRQVKYLAATGGIQPQDLIWAEGNDAAQAIPAERALDFASLRRLAQELRARQGTARPQAANGPSHSWLDEIDQLFRDPEQAVGPVPDWLQEDPPAGTAAPLPGWLTDSNDDATDEEAESSSVELMPVKVPVATLVGNNLLERMGIDPSTEHVVDWGKFNAWVEEQRRQQLAELPVPEESDPDPFHTARKQLVLWMDLAENRERLAKGRSLDARQDVRLQRYMNHFERYGLDKLARLWQYVDFLIEARTRKV